MIQAGKSCLLSIQYPDCGISLLSCTAVSIYCKCTSPRFVTSERLACLVSNILQVIAANLSRGPEDMYVFSTRIYGGPLHQRSSPESLCDVEKRCVLRALPGYLFPSPSRSCIGVSSLDTMIVLK